ncbi:outer-membrane lipoprotein carrier protein LolA [Microvirga brassicacearum]|uniref:Outer membrane lipoprotein carrier protein LolA n=1 Tax=Microvirga brassicacearum TaxID=2580413 RepID=A0A5N3PEL9_9HYPH|nr:outer-membrane lipoprotein carrier protein LolA [Microvirga brassicacearum]KAB0268085.1 outer membrane lipoprotein carrier protein LolA [Microvirga brassicacearum]
MRLTSLATVTTILALVGAGTSAAGAQAVPTDLFQPPKAALAPATIASIAEGFNLSAAPLPTATFRPAASRPVPTVSESASEAAMMRDMEDALPTSPPLPPQPVREASLKPVAVPKQAEWADGKGDAPATQKPAVTAAAGPTALAKVQQLSNRDIVDRANAYFTGLSTLVADFTQVGGDGRRLGGTLYLQRPGKIRFEYDPPATLEVIADGTSVAVRDKKLLTQDMYFIQQTPLKFLLRERVNLGGDIAITGITSEANSVRLNLEDTSTLGGTSRITLYFDPEVQNLTQWRIVDPQGFQTVVTLNKTDRGKRIDQGLFRIPNAPTIGSSR